LLVRRPYFSAAMLLPCAEPKSWGQAHALARPTPLPSRFGRLPPGMGRLGCAALASASVSSLRRHRRGLRMAAAGTVCPTQPKLVVARLPANLEETCCNNGDRLAEQLRAGGKLVWHFRHGQSTGNAAKKAARAADEGTGRKDSDARYRADESLADAPLTELGVEQAQEARARVAGWSAKPSLVVCSPLTRAIQTATLVFQDLLLEGSARLVVLPELREVHNDVFENSGRPVAELRNSKELRSSPCWGVIEAALSDDATAEWRESWDTSWARGDGWRAHVADASRLVAFSCWLADRQESMVATVSHWGTINNLMNREAWADGLPRTQVRDSWGPDTTWPLGGVARKFEMPNCGWIAVALSPT